MEGDVSIIKIDLDEFERSLPFEQRWVNQTLANDFIFGAVFRDEELCLELVRILLPELDIKSISIREVQRTAHHTLDTRGVRFDVYLRDDKGRIINVEIQIANRYNLPRRTRVYHSIIDLDAMSVREGELYKDMPEVIVIFLCAFDPFGLKRHVYTFKNMCVEEQGLPLNDGATTVFFNTKGKDKEVSPEVKAFLELLEGRSSDDEFVRRLEAKMEYAMQNRLLRQEYLLSMFERNESRAEARAEGKAEGKQEANIETAKRMRSIGMSDDQIHSLTGLSFDIISSI